MIFTADLIACSTCFGHNYAHHQELESIIQVVAACRIWCFGFQVVGMVWSWGLCVWFAGCCSMMGIIVPETCWASNKICSKNHLLHLVGILFPHTFNCIFNFIENTYFLYCLMCHAACLVSHKMCDWDPYCSIIFCGITRYLNFQTCFRITIGTFFAFYGLLWSKQFAQKIFSSLYCTIAIKIASLPITSQSDHMIAFW